MIREEADPIDQLIAAVGNLRALHEDVCVTQHALIENGRTFLPYEPTFFLYNYFCFNVAFNIDWVESKKAGTIIRQERKSEQEQIKEMIESCFQDKFFVSCFLPVFRQIVTSLSDIDTILNSMSAIVPDKIRIKAETIRSFQDACGKVLNDEVVDVRQVKTVFSFIYSVRCNIVHGTKTMQHMEEDGQRERISTYAYFIIAILHMLFMSLECESYGYYNEFMSKHFLDRLSFPRMQGHIVRQNLNI